MGICEVVTIVLIILKLVGVINWSWWLVLVPEWIPLLIILLRFIKRKIDSWGDDLY